MKTNTKKVINILLTLALIFSMITVFGGTARAAGGLTNGFAELDGDNLTILVDSDEAVEASLRIWLCTVKGEDDPALYVLDDVDYIEQPVLAVGTNEIEAVVKDSSQTPNGIIYDYKAYIIRLDASNGGITIFLEVNGDKAALLELMQQVSWWNGLGVLGDGQIYDLTHQTWADLQALYGVVQWGVLYEQSTQAQIDEAKDALQAAFDAAQKLLPKENLVLQLLSLSIKPMGTLYRFETYQLEIVDPGPGYSFDLTWSVNNPAYADIDPKTGEIDILNKTGNITITVKDEISKKSASIVVRIA